MIASTMGFVRLVWGLRLSKSESALSDDNALSLLQRWYIVSAVWGKTIIHQSSELNLKECYQYLLMEHEL